MSSEFVLPMSLEDFVTYVLGPFTRTSSGLCSFGRLYLFPALVDQLLGGHVEAQVLV